MWLHEEELGIMLLVLDGVSAVLTKLFRKVNTFTGSVQARSFPPACTVREGYNEDLCLQRRIFRFHNFYYHFLHSLVGNPKLFIGPKLYETNCLELQT